MAYKIDEEKCIGCGTCASACPMNAIKQGENGYYIDKSICIECGTCAGVCPVEAPSQE